MPEHRISFISRCIEREGQQQPLTLLGGLAAELPSEGSIVWIDRRCWPTFQLLQKAGHDAEHLFSRHFFLDPRCRFHCPKILRAECGIATGETHRVEAMSPLNGERFIVLAPTLLAAATELAIKLGFDLEE